MSEKFSFKEKFQKVFYPLLYLLTAVVFVVSGCYVFNSLYYTKIYVNGNSMAPTLIGDTNNRVHYGISDNHESTLRKLNRFDVVITYYPTSWTGDTETYKIKRVWGFPGETISLKHTKETYTFIAKKGEEIVYQIQGTAKHQKFDSYGELTVIQFKTEQKTFYTKVPYVGELSEISSRTIEARTLLDEEYFLMGDNWTDSSDSYSNMSKSERITFALLQGKVVSIQGTAKLVNGELKETDTRGAKNIF